MAGGRGKPGGIPLRDRVRVGHGTVNVPPHHQPGPRGNYGEESDHRDVHPGIHVLVVTDAGRNPGLLTEWRKHPQLPWEGRVSHGRIRDGRWLLVNEWLPAGAIEPVGGHT